MSRSANSNKTAQRFQEFGVGFFVLNVIGAVMTGSLTNAFALIAISIICTAGISLVIWIPLCIGVGWLTLTVTRSIAQSSGMAQTPPTTDRLPSSPSNPSPSNPTGAQSPIRDRLGSAASQNQIALQDYIRRAKTLGFSSDRIFTALRSQGWSDTEITTAYNTVNQ